MFQSLSARDKELQIQIGLDTLGDGNSFVARNISSFNPGDQSVQVMDTCIVACSIMHTPAFAVLHSVLLLYMWRLPCAVSDWRYSNAGLSSHSCQQVYKIVQKVAAKPMQFD